MDDFDDSDDDDDIDNDDDGDGGDDGQLCGHLWPPPQNVGGCWALWGWGTWESVGKARGKKLLELSGMLCGITFRPVPEKL